MQFENGCATADNYQQTRNVSIIFFEVSLRFQLDVRMHAHSHTQEEYKKDLQSLFVLIFLHMIMVIRSAISFATSRVTLANFLHERDSSQTNEPL